MRRYHPVHVHLGLTARKTLWILALVSGLSRIIERMALRPRENSHQFNNGHRVASPDLSSRFDA